MNLPTPTACLYRPTGWPPTTQRPLKFFADDHMTAQLSVCRDCGPDSQVAVADFPHRDGVVVVLRCRHCAQEAAFAYASPLSRHVGPEVVDQSAGNRQQLAAIDHASLQGSVHVPITARSDRS
jgi:hypothetical protein